MTTKLPTLPYLDLSTAESPEGIALVDIKLLDSFFKHFSPATVNQVKSALKSLIDGCDTLEQISDVVEEHVYITRVATQFHNARETYNITSDNS